MPPTCLVLDESRRAIYLLLTRHFQLLADLEHVWFLKAVEFRQCLPGNAVFLTQIEKRIAAFDAVDTVFGRLGVRAFLFPEDLFVVLRNFRARGTIGPGDGVDPDDQGNGADD